MQIQFVALFPFSCCFKAYYLVLTISTNAVLRLVGIDPHEKEEPVSEEDIVLMLDAGADEDLSTMTILNT